MSLLFKDNSESINGIKSQKDIILEKIHRIKSYNNNLSREYYPLKKTNTKNNTLISPLYTQSKNIVYNSNQNSLFKKVFIKPLVKKNRIYNTKQKYLTNNCTLNKNLNFSKIQKLNKNINDKLDINNNIINKNDINLQNKTITNNENSLNETTSYFDIEKLSSFNKNNTINNNIDNNIIDNFFILENAKKNNIISLKNRNNQNRKKSSEINRIWLKNDNNININILEKVHTAKGKDTININSINLISNDNIHKIDNPLYLSKIFSLSNAINENYIINNNNNQIIKTENNVRNKKIDKKMKKQYFLNKTNVDNTKTNDDSMPKSHYYSSITEVKEKSNMEETERSGLNENKNKIKKINILEAKRNILKSIEEQKQKIIDESIKNYRKYLYLIQRQQREYEEYDKYLKSELNNNKNNQLKLELFKEKLRKGVTNTTSHVNALKNKKLIIFKPRISPSEKDNKTSLPKNFDNQKYRNKNMKICTLSNNNNFDEKRLLTTSDAYEPLISEGNKCKCIYNLKASNNTKSFKPINKNILKININEIKNKNKKYNIYVNLKKKPKSSKPKKNISNANINYFSIDVFKKANPKLKKENKQQIIKFKKETDNQLTLNNIKRGKFFRELIKDIKKAKEKNNSKQSHKAVISDLGNSHIKLNSLNGLGKNEECLDINIINNFPLNNEQEIHRMITEEKKKSMNKLNTNNLKFKEKKNNINNYYYSQLKENNINNLNKEYTTESYKIKNGLYYSAFKTIKSEESNNEK